MTKEPLTVAEKIAKYGSLSEAHFTLPLPTPARRQRHSPVLNCERLSGSSRTDRISSAETCDRYPERHADLIRDFYAQLSDESQGDMAC